VWTLSGEEVAGIKASKKNLASMALSPDGKILATAGLGDDILIWSLPSGEPVGTLSGHKTAVMSLAFINEGRRLVSLGYEQAIRFWDTRTWREVREERASAKGLRGLAFSPDERIAALSLESRVQLWSVEKWALQEELPVGTKVVNGMAFSPDGGWFAAGAADKRIRVWELE
jgi:WD40 repeat protein